MKALEGVVSLLSDNIVRAEKVIEQTRGVLKDWDIDAAIAENNLYLALLKIGYSAYETEAMVRRMK